MECHKVGANNKNYPITYNSKRLSKTHSLQQLARHFSKSRITIRKHSCSFHIDQNLLQNKSTHNLFHQDENLVKGEVNKEKTINPKKSKLRATRIKNMKNLLSIVTVKTCQSTPIIVKKIYNNNNIYVKI